MGLAIKTKFITDGKGNRRQVVLDIKDYRKMTETIEDMQDAYELLKAEREAKEFIPYEKFRQKLIKEGRI